MQGSKKLAITIALAAMVAAPIGYAVGADGDGGSEPERAPAIKPPEGTYAVIPAGPVPDELVQGCQTAVAELEDEACKRVLRLIELKESGELKPGFYTEEEFRSRVTEPLLD